MEHQRRKKKIKKSTMLRSYQVLILAKKSTTNSLTASSTHSDKTQFLSTFQRGCLITAPLTFLLTVT